MITNPTGSHNFELYVGRQGLISSLAISPDEKWMVAATSSQYNTLRVWRMDPREPAFELRGHKDRVNSVAILQNPPYIVSASDDATLRLWDHESKQCVRKLEGHRGAVRAVATQRNFIISAGNDLKVKIWSHEHCLRTLSGHKSPVMALAAPEEGDVLVSFSSQDREVRLWELCQQPSRRYEGRPA
jgi:WD40 repeat protein